MKIYEGNNKSSAGQIAEPKESYFQSRISVQMIESNFEDIGST